MDVKASREYHVVVSIKQPGWTVTVNFGGKPFMYEFEQSSVASEIPFTKQREFDVRCEQLKILLAEGVITQTQFDAKLLENTKRFSNQ